MRKFLLIAGVALLTASVLSLFWTPMSFEERLIQIQLDASAPGVTEALAGQPVEVKAVILDYALDRELQLKAQAALLRYPEQAREILPLFGAEPEFQEILKSFGDGVFPPITYFLHNDIYSLTATHRAAREIETAGDTLKRLWRSISDGEWIAAPVEEDQAERDLTAEQRGWYAVNFIRSEGHDFLGQFVVDGHGQPQWIQSERILEGASSLFTGGIRKLETKLHSDQAIQAADVGWAALDLVIVGSTVKLLRMGRAASASGKSMSLATRTNLLTSRLAATGKWGLAMARHGKWPAIAVATALAVTHPGIVNDTLAAAAGLLGIPPWAGQFIGWTLILLPILFVGALIMRLLVRPMIAGLRAGLALLLWLQAKGGREKTIGWRKSGTRPVCLE